MSGTPASESNTLDNMISSDAFMVCPGDHGRIATLPAREATTLRNMKAKLNGSRAQHERNSSRTPPHSNVHHDSKMLDPWWAAGKSAALRPKAACETNKHATMNQKMAQLMKQQNMLKTQKS